MPRVWLDRGFESRSDQTKDYKIGICCFSAKQAASSRKSKNRLARNQDNVSAWGDMSIHDYCCFNELALQKIYLSVLLQYKADFIIISLKINLFWPWYSWTRNVCITKYARLYKLSNGIMVRDRPFNLKGGGYGFVFRSEFFFRTTQELEY